MSPTLSRHGCHPESSSPCMRNDVTMVDKCKHGPPTLDVYVNKNFQTNTFDTFDNITFYCAIVYVQNVIWSKYSIISKWNMTINSGNLHDNRDIMFRTFIRCLYAYNVRPVNDDVTAIDQTIMTLHYPIDGKRNSPNYARLYHCRITDHCAVIYQLCEDLRSQCVVVRGKHKLHGQYCVTQSITYIYIYFF